MIKPRLLYVEPYFRDETYYMYTESSDYDQWYIVDGLCVDDYSGTIWELDDWEDYYDV